MVRAPSRDSHSISRKSTPFGLFEAEELASADMKTRIQGVATLSATLTHTHIDLPGPTYLDSDALSAQSSLVGDLTWAGYISIMGAVSANSNMSGDLTSSSWRPDSISHLSSWVEASTGVTTAAPATAFNVSGWVDIGPELSGMSYVSGNTAPTYLGTAGAMSGCSGEPAIIFNGNFPTYLWSPPVLTGNIGQVYVAFALSGAASGFMYQTFFGVGENAPPQSNSLELGLIYDAASAAFYPWFKCWGGGGANDSEYMGWDVPIIPTGAPIPHICTYGSDGSNWYAWVDGAPCALTKVAGANDQGTWFEDIGFLQGGGDYIGAFDDNAGNPTHGIMGTIAEIIYYEGDFKGAGDRANVHNYLGNKYNVSLLA